MKSIDSIKIYIDLCGTSKDLVSEKKKKKRKKKYRSLRNKKKNRQRKKKKKGKYNKTIQK